MKNATFKITVVILTASLASCSNDKSLSGKTGTRTMPGITERGSLPEQLSSGDGTAQPATAVKGTDPIVADLPDLTPYIPQNNPPQAPYVAPPQNNPPQDTYVAPPQCNGVVINNSCQPIVAIHRCRSNNDTSFYTNHIYPSNMVECTNAGYLSEAQPYFFSLPGMDKSIIRWYRTGLSGYIQHYYLQTSGDITAGLTREGEAFRISSSDFIHPRKVALYRCVVNCAVLGNHAKCDQNMQWISTDINCEGNGVGSGAILGYAIAP